MKKIVTIIFIAVFIFSCKKKSIQRDPFTSEELEWIQNLENPRYKVVTHKKINAGVFVQSIDTVDAAGSQKIEEKDGCGNCGLGWDLKREIRINYYEGSYTLSFIDFYQFFISAAIKINNQGSLNSYKFTASMDNINLPCECDSNCCKLDTALINGITYDNVYKITDYAYYTEYGGITHKTYFKKGIGFIYLEKDSAGINKYYASLIP